MVACLLGKGSGSHHCRCKAFLDKTVCVSHGIGQDYLGEKVVHGQPFSLFMVESSEGKWWMGESVVVTMASSKWRWASCLIWERKVDVTMVAPTFPPKQAGAPSCQSIAFLDKTACASYGKGQDYLGEWVCPWPPIFPFLCGQS